jgi:hypothetical protein
MRKAINQHKTLVDLLRAMDRKNAVTITALKEEKDEVTGRKTGRLVETVRTIEIFDAAVSEVGDIRVIAMDRETGEQRSFRIDRILFYTIHRMGFVVPREENEANRREVSDELAELGPIEITESLSDRLADRADRADAHGLSHLADLLWDASDNLIWAASGMALAA